MTNAEIKKASNDYHAIYAATYAADDALHAGKAHGSIQWKGTDVCVDMRCTCGQHGHIDGEFCYDYVCSNCKKQYHVGHNVALIEHVPGMIEIQNPKEDSEDADDCQRSALPHRESRMAHAFAAFLQRLDLEDFKELKPILDMIVNAHIKGAKA